jgi:hypothetical protein
MRFPSPEEWLQLVSEFQSSELTQKEFVAKHDVSLSTFQYWLYKKSKRAVVGLVNSSPKFLPIEVVASAAPKARGPLTLIEIALPRGLVLRFPAGIDVRYIAELCAALG